MMKLTETQTEIIRAGIRWSLNILTELTGNYARKLPKPAADCLRTATIQLAEAERLIQE